MNVKMAPTEQHLSDWNLKLPPLLARPLLGLAVWYIGTLWLLLVAVPTLKTVPYGL